MIFSTQSPDIIPLVISTVLYAVVLGLDACVPWLKGRVHYIINYANIVLHIAFFLSLMFVGVYIEIPVLSFTVSLFVYSLASFSAYEKAKKQRCEHEDNPHSQVSGTDKPIDNSHVTEGESKDALAPTDDLSPPLDEEVSG